MRINEVKLNIMKKGKLLRNIIPDDEIGKRNPRFYPQNAEIEITPLGYYVPFAVPLAGWIYKNLKTKDINKDLEQGIDFNLI